MRYLYIFLLFTLSSSLQAQTTFNLREAFGFPAAVISSVHPTDTCYYIAGIVSDSVPPYATGSFLARLNLDGSIHWFKSLHGVNKTYETWHNTLLPQEDGGFVNIGYSFSDQNMYALFIRYDQWGDTLYTKEYLNPLAPEQSFFKPTGIVEDLDNNFYLAIDAATYDVGIFQDSDSYILKLDSSGNKVWGNFFGTQFWELPFSILFNQNNRLIIGSQKANDNFVTEDYKFQIHLQAIDTLGNPVWEKLSSPDILQYGAADMVELPDKTIIIASGIGTEEPGGSVSSLYFENQFWALDPLLEWSWDIAYPGPVQSNLTKPTNVISTADGNLVGAGVIVRTPMQSSTGGHYGWLTKFTPQGDSLWTRRYSGVASNSWDHEIYDVKETPDGGLIVVGMSRDKKYPWEDPQMRGWLLKLDAFGCLVPGCQANDPSSTQEIPPLQVKLYPNPAADWLYLHLGQVASSGVLSFQLLDAQGRIQQTGTLPEAQTTYLLDVASLPSGTYFLQIQEPGKIPYSETIVIQR